MGFLGLVQLRMAGCFCAFLRRLFRRWGEDEAPETQKFNHLLVVWCENDLQTPNQCSTNRFPRLTSSVPNQRPLRWHLGLATSPAEIQRART